MESLLLRAFKPRGTALFGFAFRWQPPHLCGGEERFSAPEGVVLAITRFSAGPREILPQSIRRRGFGGRPCAPPSLMDNVALADNEARQLLLLIDTAKTGKISKQEWMSFMEAEFDRLDVKKDGELDVKELTQSQLRVSRFGSVGK